MSACRESWEMTKKRYTVKAVFLVLFTFQQLEQSIGRRQLVYPEPDGRTCSKMVGSAMKGSHSLLPGNITISGRKPKIIYFLLPKTWEPGEYRCEWNLLAVSGRATEDNSLGLRLDFRWKRTPGVKEPKKCIGWLTFELPHLQFSTSFQSCGYTRKEETLPNNVRMVLHLNITENSRRDQRKMSIGEISVVRRFTKFPKRFKVDDLIRSNDTSIKDYQFTWSEARSFCARKFKGWDLCDKSSPYVCEVNRNRYFSHKNLKKTIQYFPLLNYNTWARINTTRGDCSSPAWPLPWGINKDVCPERGCDSKSYIYCCTDQPTTKYKNLVKMDISVSSRLAFKGRYYYHFKHEKFNVYNPHDYSDYDFDRDYYWEVGNWKASGRFAGDISHFQLFSQYSPRSPRAVYFCAFGSYAEEYRSMASLHPCKKPWYYKFHAYAGVKPRKGWKPIYFGQGPKDDGSRVSWAPPCCGFDDTESNFVVYGVLRNTWKLKSPSEFCKGRRSFTMPSGSLISSNLVASAPRQEIHCAWRVKVRPGRGIKVAYDYIPNDNHPDMICKRGYLEFFDPLKNQTYGRVCSKGSFITDSNVFDVSFVLEDSVASFSVNYSSVPRQDTSPVIIQSRELNGTWLRAKELCEDSGLKLCSKSDVCPLGIIPYGGLRESLTWTAVADRVNDWVHLGSPDIREWKESPAIQEWELSQGDVLPCQSHIALFGPPDWGMTNSSPHDRGVVYCCHRSEESQEKTISSHSPLSVRVNVVRRDNIEQYSFNRSEGRNSHWKPPSSFPDSPPNAIDYFTMFSEYKAECSNQVVHFCAHRHSKMHKMSLQSCSEPWIYNSHLYAGKKKCEKAAVELHVGGRGTGDDVTCCLGNDHSFTIYVINAGTEHQDLDS